MKYPMMPPNEKGLTYGGRVCPVELDKDGNVTGVVQLITFPDVAGMIGEGWQHVNPARKLAHEKQAKTLEDRRAAQEKTARDQKEQIAKAEAAKKKKTTTAAAKAPKGGRE